MKQVHHNSQAASPETWSPWISVDSTKRIRVLKVLADKLAKENWRLSYEPQYWNNLCSAITFTRSTYAVSLSLYPLYIKTPYLVSFSLSVKRIRNLLSFFFEMPYPNNALNEDVSSSDTRLRSPQFLGEKSSLSPYKLPGMKRYMQNKKFASFWWIFCLRCTLRVA